MFNFLDKGTCQACGKKCKESVRYCPHCGTEIRKNHDKYDAFISYRRDKGSEAASVIQLLLEKFGKSVFLDVTELQVGRFDEKILEVIENSGAFILILSERCLDRCINKTDWLKREILHAFEKKKKIIPVLLPDFSYPEEDIFTLLPEPFRVLPNLQAVKYSHNYRNSSVRKILEAMAAEKSSKGRWSQGIAIAAIFSVLIIIMGLVYFYHSGLMQPPPAPASTTPEIRNIQSEPIEQKTQHISNGDESKEDGNLIQEKDSGTMEKGVQVEDTKPSVPSEREPAASEKQQMETKSDTIEVVKPDTSIPQSNNPKAVHKVESIRTTPVKIRTEPSDAAIFVDGQFKGTAPATIMIAQGMHRIRCAREGYTVTEINIDVLETMEFPIKLTLKPSE